MEERSGFFTFMAGMVILVVVGVGFSMVAEKRLKFSAGQGEARDTIMAESDILEVVKDNLAKSSKTWHDAFAQSEAIEARRKKAQYSVDLAKSKIDDLVYRKSVIKKVLKETDESYVLYQTSYQRRMWGLLVGKEMDLFTTRDGRKYSKVVITNVTQAGIDIRHAYGIARIAPDNLPGDWKERFQWSPPGSRLGGDLSAAP